MRITALASATVSALALFAASVAAQTTTPSAGGAGEHREKPSMEREAPRPSSGAGAIGSPETRANEPRRGAEATPAEPARPKADVESPHQRGKAAAMSEGAKEHLGGHNEKTS